MNIRSCMHLIIKKSGKLYKSCFYLHKARLSIIYKLNHDFILEVDILCVGSSFGWMMINKKPNVATK
jgi:hypothetical protein